MLLFAVVTPTLAERSVRSSLSGTPQATVRSFLTAAVVDNDGFSASRYLSSRARLSFEDRSSTDPTADSFFGATGLTLGGLAVQSNARVKALSYRVVPAGRDRIVEVRHNGQSIDFRLRHASPTDRAVYTPGGFDESISVLATPAAAKTLPPVESGENDPRNFRTDPAKEDAYRERISQLYSQSMP